MTRAIQPEQQLKLARCGTLRLATVLSPEIPRAASAEIFGAMTA